MLRMRMLRMRMLRILRSIFENLRTFSELGEEWGVRSGECEYG